MGASQDLVRPIEQSHIERGLCFNHGIERLLHLGRQIGVRLAKRSGLRKAKVAVARKLAVILHRMWTSCPRACRQANSLLIFFSSLASSIPSCIWDDSLSRNFWASGDG